MDELEDTQSSGLAVMAICFLIGGIVFIVRSPFIWVPLGFGGGFIAQRLLRWHEDRVIRNFVMKQEAQRKRQQ